MEEFDEARHSEQNPDVAASLNEELAAHKGTGFLAPTDLSVSHLPIGRIAIVGSCLAASWGFHERNHGVPIDLILADTFGRIPSRSDEELAGYDFQVVQPPLRAIMSDDQLWRVSPDDDAQLEDGFEVVRSRMERVLSEQMAWNRQTGLLSFVVNFMVPQRNSRGRFFRRYHLSNPQYFIEKLNQAMEEYVRSYHNAYILDIDGIASSVGRRYIQDDIFTTNSHGGTLPAAGVVTDRIEILPAYSDYYETSGVWPFMNALWREILTMYRTARQVDAVKLVVTDLDDTLWHGVSGDWGENVSHDAAEGWPLGLVEALMYLKARGILLAIISKNDESRIRDIWHRVFGAKLYLDDFAVVKINWLPKTDNMAEILEGTNLLARNVVFIDDNPVERSAMKSAYPDMRVIGKHPYHLRRTLLWSSETQVAELTEESTKRTEMVHAQLERETNKKQFSREEFLAGAAPKVRMQSIDSIDHPRFARAFELLNKTNQFNTTGKRWTHEEAAAFFAQQGVFHVADVTDSYTAYGLVAVAIVRSSHIEQFVMSCRVLGYDIEIAAIADIVKGMPGGTATAQFVETNANFPCRDLFAKCGFIRTDEGRWALLEGSEIKSPPHVALERLG